jgi:hypothetical protein
MTTGRINQVTTIREIVSQTLYTHQEKRAQIHALPPRSELVQSSLCPQVAIRGRCVSRSPDQSRIRVIAQSGKRDCSHSPPLSPLLYGPFLISPRRRPERNTPDLHTQTAAPRYQIDRH